MAALDPVPIFNGSTSPIAAGNGEIFPGQMSQIDAGTVFDAMGWIFNNSGTRDGIDVLFRVPTRYSTGTNPTLQIPWIANLASALSVIFDWEPLARVAGEDMGGAAGRVTETVTDTSTGAAFQLEVAVITLTAADYAAGDYILGRLLRSSDLAGDDSNVDIWVGPASFDSFDA